MGLRETVVAIAKDEKIDLVGFARVDQVNLACSPRRDHDLKDLCNECLRCVKACPVQALNADPNATPRLDQQACKTYYVRPFLYPSALQSLRSLLTTPGIGTTGIQYLLEGYYFCCAECQRVCPSGRLSQRKKARLHGELQEA